MGADDYLARVEAAAEAATAGPWGMQPGSSQWVVRPDVDSDHDDYWVAETWADDGADADFIALSREAVPRMAAALRAVLNLCALWARTGDPVPSDVIKYAIASALEPSSEVTQ